VAREGGESSPRQRLIRLLTRRPVAVLSTVVCAAVLVAAATGLRDMSIGLPVLNDLGPTTQVARATRAAGLGFAPGIVSPTLLLVEEQGIVKHGARLARLEGLLTRQPGVAGVIGPREQPTGHAFGVVLAKNGGAARFVIILNADPYGSRAIAAVRALEDHIPALLRASGLSGAHAGFGGDTAISKETIDSVLNSLLPVGIAIGVVELFALGLLLRSLVAPLYLLVASALSMTAPLGLTAYLFQRLLGQADLAFYVPLGVGVLLIALGSDYNLFVTGRVWEEARAPAARGHHHGRSARQPGDHDGGHHPRRELRPARDRAPDLVPRVRLRHGRGRAHRLLLGTELPGSGAGDALRPREPLAAARGAGARGWRQRRASVDGRRTLGVVTALTVRL